MLPCRGVAPKPCGWVSAVGSRNFGKSCFEESVLGGARVQVRSFEIGSFLSDRRLHAEELHLSIAELHCRMKYACVSVDTLDELF